MTTKEFNALFLKGAELVKITNADGTTIKAVLLNNVINMNKILIYNLEKKIKNQIQEEYITIDKIHEIEVLP